MWGERLHKTFFTQITNVKLNQEYLDDDQVNPAYFFDDDTDANTKLCMDLFAKEMSFREYR